MNTSGNVPVSPALQNPTNSVEDVRRFASEVGYPIMVKAVDGGGGRGIRLIRSEEQLASLVKRAVEESPSKQIFAEKAAVDGFRHVGNASAAFKDVTRKLLSWRQVWCLIGN
jgi:biotin carboxylase